MPDSRKGVALKKKIEMKFNLLGDFILPNCSEYQHLGLFDQNIRDFSWLTHLREKLNLHPQSYSSNINGLGSSLYLLPEDLALNGVLIGAT